MKKYDAVRRTLREHQVRPYIQPSKIIADRLDMPGKQRELFAEVCKDLNLGPVAPLWKTYREFLDS